MLNNIPFGKQLNEYTDEQLVELINNNNQICLKLLSGITSEILRRMNQRKPLLSKQDQDWGNPLTP